MALSIRDLTARDIRFPTSRQNDGSDALNRGDYSATYVVLETDGGLRGHGLTFTNGRGNEVVRARRRARSHRSWWGATSTTSCATCAGSTTRSRRTRSCAGSAPRRASCTWRPAPSSTRSGTCGRAARRSRCGSCSSTSRRKQLVSCIDFTWITDALTPEQAVALLKEKEAGKAAREADIRAQGYPAYTTSAGWLGYSDEKVRRLSQEAVAAGWTHIKMKVGKDQEDERPPRRASSARRSARRAR